MSMPNRSNRYVLEAGTQQPREPGLRRRLPESIVKRTDLTTLPAPPQQPYTRQCFGIGDQKYLVEGYFNPTRHAWRANGAEALTRILRTREQPEALVQNT